MHDAGVIECEDGGCSAKVIDVVRLGDDQALVLAPEKGELHDGERVYARVDRRARRATECNHTATHLLHAALRERLGTHVRQAGSYVGPDKLRFDFTHGAPLCDDDRRWVEDRVNQQILENQPVRALTTTLDEARALGAMALFGEKYGDVVRMVEVGAGDWSRELCGGTHVRSTAEIGVFKITQETSSAANVRRIEAITGPLGIELLRKHDRELTDAAVALRTQPDAVAEVAEAAVRKRRELEKQLKEGATARRRTSPSTWSRSTAIRAVFEIKDVAESEGAARPRGPLQEPARRPRGGRARRARRGPRDAARGRDARRDRARREGRRGREGGGGGGRRRRWRPRQHGPGRRPRSGQAAGRARGGARGDRARACES